MTTWFDESRLDDERALLGIDPLLRSLAESGARVRREAAEATGVTVDVDSRPRAVLAAGPDSRLLRAVLEPWCPVPFVAWPAPGLPGWVGSLDLVVVLAPEGSDRSTASAVAEAARRGASLVVACPPRSLVAEHATGRHTVLLPTVTGDQLAAAVVMLDQLSRLGLGPAADAEEVAHALDTVAIACSPHEDLASNPAKELAISLADANPVLWGGSVLAARAARRVAEAIRQQTGRAALAGDAEHLLPVLDAAKPRSVFDDPFASDTVPDRQPVLVILDDGADDAMAREERGRLRAAATARGVRIEELTAVTGSELARYASLLSSGRYATAYLALGLVSD